MATFPRSLLPDERHIVDVLLSRPFPERDELQAQAADVRVTGLSCGCGCPSVALAADRSAPPALAAGSTAQGYGVDRDGNLVAVALLVDGDGDMHELDITAVGIDVHGRPTTTTHGRPTVESFQVDDGTGETLRQVTGWSSGKS